MAPKQVLTVEIPSELVTNNGWLLLFHRDFLMNTTLANKIRQYEYFSYKFNQVLSLSDDEEGIITAILKQMAHEQHQLKETNTKDVIVALLELLLAYAERYYRATQLHLTTRQGQGILVQLEIIIDNYLQGPELVLKGIPTIKYLSDRLNISPNYLSRLLQNQTGRTTKQILHEKLIAFAEEQISNTSSSISEIAYRLGFKSPQTFSRLFKTKTGQSPTEFRNAF